VGVGVRWGSRVLESRGGWRGEGHLGGLGAKRPVGGERRGLPVGLVEVEVERPRPVGEDALLSDEAVVASAATALVGDVHGALIRTPGLVVVVRDRLVLRLPERERER